MEDYLAAEELKKILRSVQGRNKG